MTSTTRLAAVAALTGALAFASAAAAQPQWSDRTTFTFDAPIVIPGATLPAGTYVFKLMDSPTNRHLVQIFNEDETRLMATAQAIPTRRQDPRGDVVVRMVPTEAGVPAAIKAWFYPGSLYGHEFIYPDDEGRQIAQRSKTLVLSTDVPGTDVQKGTLYVYDAEGRRGTWKEDAVTIREWQQWRQQRQATAKVAAPGTPGNREASAPIVQSQPAGMKVTVDDLETDATKYTGKVVSVTAEVEEVFGPRLFKIDERGWADFDGEVLVYLPSNFAALVREDDLVTVTGTMKMLDHPAIHSELAWLQADAESAAEMVRRPILMASSIVGGNNNVALAIEVTADRAATRSERGSAGAERGATGTAGSAASTEKGDAAPASGRATTAGTTGASDTGRIVDAAALRGAGRDDVGRQVRIEGARVTRVDKDHGFWISAGSANVFVLPVDRERVSATVGSHVTVDGILLEMPRRLRAQARGAGDMNDRVYIHARSVQQ